MKFLLIAVSALLLLPNFFNIHLESKPQYDNKELFNPGLAYINSTDKLVAVCDSIAKVKNIEPGTLKYAITASEVIRNRFYHGFSRYPINEHWISATSELLFGNG